MPLIKKLANLFLWLLITSSCTLASDSEVDQSFLTDQPCPAPCWYHLVPGKSTKEEVMDTLKGLPFIDYNSLKEYPVRWDDNSALRILFDCKHPKEETCGHLLISNNTLMALTLEVYFPLDIETVVDKFGPPSYIDYGPYAPEVGGCQIFFNWPELKISAVHLDTRKILLCTNLKDHNYILGDTEINSISYSVKELFTSEPGGCCQRIEWPGFD